MDKEHIHHLIKKVEGLINTWTEGGHHPEHHREMQDKIREEWPTLGKCLDDIARFPVAPKSKEC